jgi:hypothetical protein
MHAYPADLARFVEQHLEEIGEPVDVDALGVVLSVGYQAGLMREEERPVAFRLWFTGRRIPTSDDAGPTGRHVLRFDRPRPLDEHEVRRLAPAARLERAMIGVSGGDTGLVIWGMARTGTAWLDAVEAGREPRIESPQELVITVSGPGRIHVSLGGLTIAKLAGGVITGMSRDVFESQWLRDACADTRRELLDAQASHRSRVPSTDAGILQLLDQQLVRRIIATVRHARHGGTIVLMPQSRAEDVAHSGRPIALKYRFDDDTARKRYANLQLKFLERLNLWAEHGEGRMPDWKAGPDCSDPEIVAIDEAFSELAHTIASLSEVDGVVLVSKRFEVMGFGGEIVGELPDVPTVMRALDLEGERRVEESTERVGTRHRSLYRLVAAVPS